MRWLAKPDIVQHQVGRPPRAHSRLLLLGLILSSRQSGDWTYLALAVPTPSKAQGE
jgi:hypothetical protein